MAVFFSMAAFLTAYGLYVSVIAVKPDPPLMQESNASCRPEGTPDYSSDAYSQLKDILVYDRGPGWLHSAVLRDKVERFVQQIEYHALKALMQACAPQFRESSDVGGDPSKRGVLSGTLRRSRIDIDDDREKKQFSGALVMLKAL